ncbi:MAG: HlyC/CorC family transporter [Lachnospiraceae bacterium]|nr:HlyC/CorC family transporter [Lachnospiraceae bacterium]
MQLFVIELIILFILIVLSAFFSSAETALTAANKVRLRSLEEEGNKRAARVNKLLDHNSKMLSAILIGNNVVNLSASALAATMAMRISLAVSIATFVLTLVILIFGEVIPKTWAMHFADRLALAYGGVIYALTTVLTPLIFLIDKISGLVLFLFHVDPNEKTSTMTENELKTYVDVSHEDGVIESEEREIIYNVFEFSDALAKDIMIPKVNMVTVNVNDDYHEVLSVFRKHMYTRLPVYEEDKDNIIGLINIKDFILTDDPEHFQIRNILREAHFTYEYKKISDLLYEIREKTTSVTFVVNEYGVTVGMITLEDLLEEIVGEIRDEYDQDEVEKIKKIDDRNYLIEGSMNLDDVNDTLGISLASEEYDSIGGILIEHLDDLPEDGESVTLEDGTVLKVQGLDQNRIVKVLLTLPEAKEVQPSEENATAPAKEYNMPEGHTSKRASGVSPHWHVLFYVSLCYRSLHSALK